MVDKQFVKVLVVETTEFGYDGISSVVTNYYLHQNHQNVKMDILTINPVSENLQKEINFNGDKNIVLEYRNKNPLRYVIKLIGILRKGKYDIIHVHGCSATMFVEMLSAIMARTKVRIVHSHNTKCDHEKIDKLLRPVFSRLYTHAFACGTEAGEWLFPEKQFYVVSNGIDLNKFQYDEVVRNKMREKYDLNGKFVVGHVGRFSDQKNHKKLLEIYNELSKQKENIRLILIGDGELRSEIEDIAKKNNLDVLFIGLSDEVEKWLQVFDVMVFPSLFEGLPVGIVEAQASGVPCILSDTISKATKITEIIEFVELNASSEKWIDVINSITRKVDRCAQKDKIRIDIQQNGFDIKYNCKQMCNMYCEFAKVNFEE